MPARQLLEMRCTQLCRHGPEHSMSSCAFAHRLAELRPPIEHVRRFDGAWGGCQFDRFYGQYMSDEQIDRFWVYWHAHPHERPAWAVGLYLLLMNAESTHGMAYSWDFGLSLDIDLLICGRNLDGSAGQVPFRYYPRLWDRLGDRRRAMDRYMHLPGALSCNLGDDPVQPIPVDQSDMADVCDAQGTIPSAEHNCGSAMEDASESEGPIAVVRPSAAPGVYCLWG